MPDQFVGNAQRCVPNVLRLNCFYLNIEHYRRMVGSLIFRTTYGYRVEKINDLYVNAAQDFMNIFIHAMIGDVLPFRKLNIILDDVVLMS